MALDNVFYYNPEKVLEFAQLQKIKHTSGCAACINRDLNAVVFGKSVCWIEGSYPGNLGFCKKWQLDEGLKNGNS